MYCSKCGKELEEGSKYCPSCGTKVDQGIHFDDLKSSAETIFNETEKGLNSAITEVENDFNNTNDRLNEDRDIISYILLSIITCGIYGYYFIYKMAEDVNITCSGDGQETPGLLPFILLSIITCGLYAYYWYYCLGNRLYNNASRYGLYFNETGTTILLWCVIGMLICGLGQYVAMYFLMKNMNAICHEYNTLHNL